MKKQLKRSHHMIDSAKYVQCCNTSKIKYDHFVNNYQLLSFINHRFMLMFLEFFQFS
jgi:hypothetical protein